MILNNDHWLELRTMILDPKRWDELRDLLGLSQADGEEMSPSRMCTGVMPESVECQYVMANAGADFWHWCMSVSLLRVASSRVKEWYRIPHGKPHGGYDSFLLSRLSDANLRYADLSETNLMSIDLRRADLIGTNLSDTDLRHADLRRASYSNETVLPEGFIAPWRGMVKR